LGERLNGIQEVVGSIPISSTIQEPKALPIFGRAFLFFVESPSSTVVQLVQFFDRLNPATGTW
jgi:hypothetical protein